MNNIEILKEFENQIIPLQPEEFKQLEKNIIHEGCRDPLVVWKKGDKRYLLDGHNRFRICTRHDLPYHVTELEFKNTGEASLWILNNQIGRRNLNPDQMSYYRGMKYESMKKERGGFEYVKSKGQNVLPTSEKIAREFNVNERTIKRDAQFARGLNFVGRHNPELKTKILTGEEVFKKSDISLLGDSDNQSRIRKIINAKDLQVKIERIKNEVLDSIEKKLDETDSSNLEKAREFLQSTEPVFLDRESRINQIKGRILSQLNIAIRDSNIGALNEIEKLVDKLKMILSDK